MNKNMQYQSEYEYESQEEYAEEEYAQQVYVQEYQEEYVPSENNDRVYWKEPKDNCAWDEDNFDLTIPKIIVPKVPKRVLKNLSSSSFSSSFSYEMKIEEEFKPEKAEIDLTKFLKWGNKPEVEEKPEREVDVEMDRFIRWGKSTLDFPEVSESVKKPEQPNNDFPSLEDSSVFKNNQQAVRKTNIIKFPNSKTRFVKLNLAEVEKECLDIVKQELEIINIETKVPNLYLSKRKSREYCESVARGNSCYRKECKAAHSLEDYLPRRCSLLKDVCDERQGELNSVNKTNEICKLKHDDETFENFLFRMKMINSFMLKKLTNVRDKNKAMFKSNNPQRTFQPQHTQPQRTFQPQHTQPVFNYHSYLAAAIKRENEEETPVEDKETPVEVKETPVEVKETPVEDKETPVEDKETPVEVKETWTIIENHQKQNVRNQAIDTLSDSSKIGKTLSKTKLCIHWQKYGKCPRENQCGFAHGKEELKIAACIFGERCKKTDCKFAHPGEPDKRSEAFEVLSDSDKLVQKLSKTKLCIHWQKNGKCPRGNQCGFAHGEEELQVTKCIFGPKCRKPNCRFQH